MTQNEPTTAHLLAASAGLIMTMRQMIDLIDRTNPDHIATTLDAIHEYLAVAGGSIATVADRLGCEEEFARHIRQGRGRVAALQASSGLGGRA